MPDRTKIDELAERVWRRVIGWDTATVERNLHPRCLTRDPDDCALYREIWDEINTWATEQTKEGM